MKKVDVRDWKIEVTQPRLVSFRVGIRPLRLRIDCRLLGIDNEGLREPRVCDKASRIFDEDDSVRNDVLGEPKISMSLNSLAEGVTPGGMVISLFSSRGKSEDDGSGAG